ncbi:M67 family metallopeptidase [Novosphingobium sp. BW1]|uniref:M67 family metallopeptidase n=1 Tax=Novosphingobium sp. BW1 TaxID=2592621 RepID=UPI0011DEF1E6|nr:M67 family metallopeptidase [Novosphingobium sp. BW1]TYC81595.1 M67 family metallopeptidase [Novosphingobium sp. BW1]
MDIDVTREVLETLHRLAAAAHPHECCGLLLGAPGSRTAAEERECIVAVLESANVDPYPAIRFAIDPLILLRAHKAARTGGPSVLGYYHSHPTGKPAPSVTDCEHSTGDCRIWAIVAGDDVAFWRDRGNGFDPLAFQEV